MTGALLWVVYGVLIAAHPVVVANLLVFGAAAWTMTRSPKWQAGTRTAAARGDRSQPAT